MNEGDDDHIVGAMVFNCFQIMKEYPTSSRLTACFNLTARVLGLFTYNGDKESVFELIDKFCESLKHEIKDYYE